MVRNSAVWAVVVGGVVGVVADVVGFDEDASVVVAQEGRVESSSCREEPFLPPPPPTTLPHFSPEATPLSWSVRSLEEEAETSSPVTTTTCCLAWARAAAKRVAEEICFSTRALTISEKRWGKSRMKMRASAANRDRAREETSRRFVALNFAFSTSFSVLAVARMYCPVVDLCRNQWGCCGELIN